MRDVLRDFRPEDAIGVKELALAAFDEYRSAYSDWPAFSEKIGKMAALARHGEIIVAVARASLVGAVVYVGPGKEKAACFHPDWSIIRMLVVHPECRGQGLGRALTEECIRRAERDGCPSIALHTAPIMAVALGMYQRMGFAFLSEAPPIFGVPYGIYLKHLRGRSATADDEQSARI
jgi:ribosomal protein S18 acetylase RimI-like enzyme